MNSVCQKLKVSPFRFMLLQQLDTLYDECPFSTHGALALGSQSSCAINGRLLRKGLRYYQRTNEVPHMILLHFQPPRAVI